MQEFDSLGMLFFSTGDADETFVSFLAKAISSMASLSVSGLLIRFISMIFSSPFGFLSYNFMESKVSFQRFKVCDYQGVRMIII